MAEYGEWNRKGATLSDVTAQKEYGTMDANVTMSDGATKRLSEFWAGGRVVLVFLRHFG